MKKLALLITLIISLLSCTPKSVPRSNTPAPTSTVEPASTPLPLAGQTRFDEKGIEQVWVPAGSFRMGTDEAAILALKTLNPPGFILGEFPSEQPAHEARITAGYWIDKYEVTNAAFQAFVKDGGYQNKAFWSEAGWKWLSSQYVEQLPRYCLGNVSENPVACVTWYEAEAYAHWRGGRLPTEAEWEYAARGPQASTYPWGNEFDSSRCNIVDSKGLKPVGSYPTGGSWVGALDMAGNVMEWVQDWLGPYSDGPAENSAGPATGKVKVEKGGWWGGTFFVARSAYRHFEDPPEYGDMHIGFRAVSPTDLPQPASTFPEQTRKDDPLTVAEAEKPAGFEVKQPTYLPKGVFFEYATYETPGFPGITLYFKFIHEQYGDMGHFFLISQEQKTEAPPDALSCGEMTEGCEVLEINGVPVIYHEYPQVDTGASTESFAWYTDGIFLRLHRMAGEPNKLYKKELLKVVESMK